MSQLDQAKKEAKRLFGLAQKNSSPQENTITFKNLSSAKEVIAVINGYKNWHEYEENLKKKDYIFDKQDKANQFKEEKLIEKNEKYFIQELEFIPKTNFKNSKSLPIVVQKEHLPILLGSEKKQSYFESVKKSWLLNQYPVLITGGTGSGKTELLLSLSAQYIKNTEGVIYIDGKGSTNSYIKIFSHAQNNNCLKDLYCINFLTGDRKNNDLTEKNSHSIDPINPMIGNQDYFHFFFDQKIGDIIHAILKRMHLENQLLDIQSLESILMLKNLIKWQKEKKFGDMVELNNYMESLNLDTKEDISEEEIKEALKKHALNAYKAYETVKLFKEYPHIFKSYPTVDMEKIFLERKILTVLLPALEKSLDITSKLGELITQQILYMEKKLAAYQIHFQNIVLDEFVYYFKNYKDLNFKETKNNYLFSSFGFEYAEQPVFNFILLNTETYVVMKLEEKDLPIKLKIDIINNMENPPPIVHAHKFRKTIKNWHPLNQQMLGQAVVFCKNETLYDKNQQLPIINDKYKYYVQQLECVCLTTSRQKQIWLVDHSYQS